MKVASASESVTTSYLDRYMKEIQVKVEEMIGLWYVRMNSYVQFKNAVRHKTRESFCHLYCTITIYKQQHRSHSAQQHLASSAIQNLVRRLLNLQPK